MEARKMVLMNLFAGPDYRLRHREQILDTVVVMSNSLWPHWLYSQWNSPGQNTGVGNLSLLQRTFPTQGSNPGLLHCRRILYQLSNKGSLGEEEGEKNWENSIDRYTLLYVKQMAMGNCCVTQRVRHAKLWQPGEVRWGEDWWGGSRGRGHMYTNDWFMLLYGRSQHNIVKQLSSN